MNLVNLNLDMMNLVKDAPETCSVFYFLTAEGEEQDFLYAKGNLDDMSEALVNLMRQNEDLEWVILNAVKDFTE